MKEFMDEREVKYLGQEAAIALNNRALISACEEMSQEALNQLIEADPNDWKAVAICQLRIKAVAEVAEKLEHMAARATAMAEADEMTLKDLN
jgi:hypothetical protein